MTDPTPDEPMVGPGPALLIALGLSRIRFEDDDHAGDCFADAKAVVGPLQEYMQKSGLILILHEGTLTWGRRA
jgi:hypothetical protein